ncbi:MAG: hypothetical protein KA408_14285 [Flavobacteriales bacterium]|nr:hypothetical protein [Flavobacteriales bacterium]
MNSIGREPLLGRIKPVPVSMIGGDIRYPPISGCKPTEDSHDVIDLHFAGSL